MNHHPLFRTALCTLLVFLGCSSAPPPRQPVADAEPKRQLELAQSFEAESDFRRAAFLYQLIAQKYPPSSVTMEATRKAAVLAGTVRNSARDDSTSLQWFRRYLSLSLTPAEREHAELSIFLLERISMQQRLLAQQRQDPHQAILIDSLQQLVQHQWATITSQSQRIQDLERDVLAANAEVKKLKDIDVRLSQSRQRH